MPRARRRSPSSPASRAAPSIASALVSSTRSPVRAERLSFSSARRSVPERRERHDGSGDGVRDFRVAAGQGGAGIFGGRCQPAEDGEGLRRRGAHGQQDRRQQPAGVRAGGGDVVDVDEDGGAADGVPAQSDRIAVGHEELGAAEVDGGHILADPRGHEQGRVVSGDAGEKPGQQVVRQLARRQGHAEPDDVRELGQAADDEVAVGRVRPSGVLRAGSAASLPAAVGEVRGDGAGGAPRLHVEQVVADHECLLRSGAHQGGGVQHAVRRRLGRHVVVAGHDDVEIGGGEGREAAQSALDGGQPVAREDADGKAVLLEPADELFSAFVRRRGVGGGKFEALEGEGCGVAFFAARQPQDPLEDELVRRTADLALDRGEVERAGVGQRAVEVEQDGTEPERPRGADAGAALPAVTARRP